MGSRSCILGVAAFLLCLLLPGVFPKRISPSKTVVWGPGIHKNSTGLPLNYFYLQAKDEKGKSITDCKKDAFQMELVSPTGRVRRRQAVDYLGRGLFLFYYRMFGDYEEVSLEVKHAGKHIAGSPYSLGPMFHDDCYCPLLSPDEWLQDYDCPAELDPQIVEDLEPFRESGINMTELFSKASEGYKTSSFIHYSIIDHKLYAQPFGSIVGFKSLSDMILLSLINKVKLPNMELIVNLGDWPLNKKGRGRSPLATFSWCGSQDTWDIVWPTWDLMKSTIMGLDRVSLSMLSIQEPRSIPWSQREPRVFFRGRDSNKARLELVKKHRTNTELFDVGIVAWFFFKHEEDVYGPVANRVGFNDFFKYKYQISIDGTVAAYRFPFLMAGGSLILKQDSNYYEHFYRHLVPWQHYIPVKENVEDLLERVKWARAHDKDAKKMAENSVKFAESNLLPDHLYCYMVRLLKEYAATLVGKPRIHPKMEPVPQELSQECVSVCSKLRSRKKKKQVDPKVEL